MNAGMKQMMNPIGRPGVVSINPSRPLGGDFGWPRIRQRTPGAETARVFGDQAIFSLHRKNIRSGRRFRFSGFVEDVEWISRSCVWPISWPTTVCRGEVRVDPRRGTSWGDPPKHFLNWHIQNSRSRRGSFGGRGRRTFMNKGPSIKNGDHSSKARLFLVLGCLSAGLLLSPFFSTAI